MIADDYPGLIVAFRRLLERSCDVVGSAASGYDTIEATRTLRPDVVVLDLSLPDMDGLDACRTIRQTFPDVRVILVTAMTAPDMDRLATEAGASAFIVKHRAAIELEPIIHDLFRTARR